MLLCLFDGVNFYHLIQFLKLMNMARFMSLKIKWVQYGIIIIFSCHLGQKMFLDHLRVKEEVKHHELRWGKMSLELVVLMHYFLNLLIWMRNQRMYYAHLEPLLSIIWEKEWLHNLLFLEFFNTLRRVKMKMVPRLVLIELFMVGWIMEKKFSWILDLMRNFANSWIDYILNDTMSGKYRRKSRENKSMVSTEIHQNGKRGHCI